MSSRVLCIRAAAAASLLALTGIAAPAARAAASGPPPNPAGPLPARQAACGKGQCDGQKPELAGCDKDGRTIRTGSVFDKAGKLVGRIELRWSPSCDTDWARVTSTIGGQKLSATVTRADAKAFASDFQGTQTWSPMVGAGGQKAVATGWIGAFGAAVADGAPGSRDQAR